jgi:small subunit ribosomal protein S6
MPTGRSHCNPACNRLAPMTQAYYETMYILRPDIPEEEVETHVTSYRNLVTEAAGEVLDCQMRGKRRLAYPIAKHREGIYVQLNHNGDGQHVAVLERAMRLSEDVIRYLTVKQDGPMPAPRSLPSSASEETPTETATEA